MFASSPTAMIVPRRQRPAPRKANCTGSQTMLSMTIGAVAASKPISTGMCAAKAKFQAFCVGSLEPNPVSQFQSIWPVASMQNRMAQYHSTVAAHSVAATGTFSSQKRLCP